MDDFDQFMNQIIKLSSCNSLPRPRPRPYSFCCFKDSKNVICPIYKNVIGIVTIKIKNKVINISLRVTYLTIIGLLQYGNNLEKTSILLSPLSFSQQMLMALFKLGGQQIRYRGEIFVYEVKRGCNKSQFSNTLKNLELERTHTETGR